jgi:hypothetical protein
VRPSQAAPAGNHRLDLGLARPQTADPDFRERRRQVHHRAIFEDRAMFYSAETLGPKQSLLPSGTLLCRDAPIARTGTQRYHVTELPEVADAAVADEDGMISVARDASEVFSPRSMASFEGAAVTLGHPDDVVGPDNWADLTVGHVMNVRRDGDLLVGDLLIPDQRPPATDRRSHRSPQR